VCARVLVGVVELLLIVAGKEKGSSLAASFRELEWWEAWTGSGRSKMVSLKEGEVVVL